MSPRAVWRISVVTTREGEEAVTDLMNSLFGLPATAYVDFESGQVTVAVYNRSRPGRWEEKRARLREGLKLIRRCGLSIGGGRILLRRLRGENWAESWKRHFQPIDISGALLVRPSWSKRRPRPGQQEIVLDPGLSFGTGHHATTQFCLQEIVRRRKAGRPQSFLDIGAGSGILAIAAARLGYEPVRGFDLDTEAVRVARANVRVNKLAGRVRISRQDICRMSGRRPGQYDLVCANLISNLLVKERRKIIRFLRPGGVLVLAGILKSEFSQVRKAFTSMGLRQLSGGGEKEWYSGAFQRAAL